MKKRAAMMWRAGMAALAIGGLLATCAVYAQVANGPDLNALRNKNRVLLVFAPEGKDAHLAEQKRLWDGERTGFAERDLRSFTLTAPRSKAGSPEATLRRQYKIKPEQFKVVLIGKDGHTTFTFDKPLPASKLYGLIDAMPMRREEMRRQGKS